MRFLLKHLPRRLNVAHSPLKSTRHVGSTRLSSHAGGDGWAASISWLFLPPRDAATRLGVTALAAVALGAALILAGLYAYYVLFSNFAFYDDEGFLNISLRHFLQGRPIYDDVFTQYGPFFYLFNGAIFWLTSVAVDSSSMRLLVCALWLVTVSLGALYTARITRSLPLAVAVLVVGTPHLRVLANEPGHPQALALMLFMALPALATFLTDSRRALVCGVLGALGGCLLMTKMNVGVFALLALALTLSSGLPGRAAALLQVLASLAIAVLPAILMRTHLGHPLVDRYALFVTLIALPVIVLHWGERAVPYLRVRDGVWAAVGCTAAIVLIGAAISVHGTSLRELVIGPLDQAAKFPTIRWAPLLLSGRTVGFAAAMVGMFVVLHQARRRWAERTAWQLALCAAKIAFGAHMLVTLLGARAGAMWFAVGTYGSNPQHLFDVGLPLVWLTMMTPDGTRAEPWQRFGRALLCAVTVLNSLQAYPVPGSQWTLAAVPVVLAAAVCLGDGLTTIVRLLPDGLRGYWVRTGAAGAALVLLLLEQWSMTQSVRRQYEDMVPLDLPGTSRMRLVEGNVALYRWLALNLHDYADTFIGMPALNSLYFWSEKEPPTALNPNSWMLLLDDAQQQRVVDALAAHPRACVVSVPRLSGFWMSNRPMDQQPLTKYIHSEFRTVGRFSGYEFLVRKQRSTPELMYCARRESLNAPGDHADWVARVSLPVMNGRAVYRMTVADARSGRTIADTVPRPAVALLRVSRQPVNSGEVPVALAPHGLPLDDLQRFVLRVESGPPSLDSDSLVVRLMDGGNRVFATLPVVS